MMVTLGFQPEKKEDYRHMDILILMVAKKFDMEKGLLP
jgi:hypothetical protein